MLNKREKAINGWWIPINPYAGRDYGFTPLSEINNGYAFKVYLCPSCSRVYENAWEYGTGNQLLYYESFPTLGLKRVECSLCDCNED